MIGNRITNFTFRRHKWRWDFEKIRASETSLKSGDTESYKIYEYKDEARTVPVYEHIQCTVFEISHPFGFHNVVQSFGGESIVTWMASGGHGANFCVTKQSCDSPIEIWNFPFPWEEYRADKEGTKDWGKEGYNRSRDKFVECLGKELTEELNRLKITKLYEGDG